MANLFAKLNFFEFQKDYVQLIIFTHIWVMLLHQYF